MERKYLTFLFTTFYILSFSLYAQTGKSPYPIIFVHGLSSSDSTWLESINYISDITGYTNPYNNNGIFHAVLNKSTTTSYTEDVQTKFNNLANTLNNNDIYCINFENSYDSSEDNILIHQDQNIENESESNESSIAKQGYTLKIMIDSVLKKTNAEKVILFGHSMGGLAIREYLQKTNDRGEHTWWIDPTDSLFGHKVAKVVTFGSPHGGSDLSDVPSILSDWLADIDTRSEAVRDLRNSNNGEDDAIYLFGDNENIDFVTNPYNMDVNCDGDEVDNIKGLNNEDFIENIEYTWITSQWLFFVDGDGVVKLRRQFIEDVGDTLKTNKLHTDEPKDKHSIIRGLDEPDSKNYAYLITPSSSYTSFNRTIKGFITYQMNNVSEDKDYFEIMLPFKGETIFDFSGENSGITQLSILNEQEEIVSRTSDFPATINLILSSGTYYIKIDGEASQHTWENPYTLTFNYEAKKVLLSIKTFLEGPYNSLSMDANLNNQNIIPLKQPYNKAPWNYSGTEKVTDIPQNIVDWVLVELRSGISASTKIATRAAFIRNDGMIVDLDGTSDLSVYGVEEGNYYIVVHHRNHLSIMSSEPEFISEE